MHRFLTPCQNLDKTNDTIPRKHLDRQKDGKMEGGKDGWKDGQTLFHRTLSATAGGPKKKINEILRKKGSLAIIYIKCFGSFGKKLEISDFQNAIY